MPGPRETPDLVRHCVAAVAKQYGGDTSKAFAICVAQLQKSGYLKPGTMELTAAGKKKEKEHEAEPDAEKKLAAYEKLLKAARKEEAKNPDMSWIVAGNEAVPADGSNLRVKILRASKAKDTVEYEDLKTKKRYEKDFFGFWTRYMLAEPRTEAATHIKQRLLSRLEGTADTYGTAVSSLSSRMAALLGEVSAADKGVEWKPGTPYKRGMSLPDGWRLAFGKPYEADASKPDDISAAKTPALSPDRLTGTNIDALDDQLKQSQGVIGRVAAVRAPHIKRAIQAGVLVPGKDKGTWVLSDKWQLADEPTATYGTKRVLKPVAPKPAAESAHDRDFNLLLNPTGQSGFEALPTTVARRYDTRGESETAMQRIRRLAGIGNQ